MGQSSKRHYSRRAFLSTAIAGSVLAAKFPIVEALSADEIKLISPNGEVQFQLLSHVPEQARYKVTFKNRAVIETSRMGIVVDGVDLGHGIEVGRVERYRVREKYPSRGVHSEAVNDCNGAKISAHHKESRTDYTIEVRAFNDGVAFRYIVPGENKERVPDEATAFTVPAGSIVWFHDFEGHYEGIHKRKEIADVKENDWAAPPLTIKLPEGLGYAALTEAALMNYAGMGFRADGRRGFLAVLGHALPVSHPFDLRYGKDEAKRLAVPASITGTITTPWRVLMVGADLNALVNCDIVNNVSPPPDQTLFPAGIHTEWLRPGRAVWKYLDGGENTLEGMKEFSRLAGELGFEHNIVEGFWHKWSESDIRGLVDYSKQYKVGLWFWEHSKNLRTRDAREKFFKLLQSTGVVGAKIDFFDHEAKRLLIYIRRY
ncbi:MAG TPA: glycoside hydrolase family 97 N-terminal domain-containing protein [Pyrinomonadaceae bacterium]|nr:glycoside hydrolase family 97 N-terminal domain-containing protein [Pyrinomonadaceae bacterium]